MCYNFATKIEKYGIGIIIDVRHEAVGK